MILRIVIILNQRNLLLPLEHRAGLCSNSEDGGFEVGILGNISLLCLKIVDYSF